MVILCHFQCTGIFSLLPDVLWHAFPPISSEIRTYLHRFQRITLHYRKVFKYYVYYCHFYKIDGNVL